MKRKALLFAGVLASFLTFGALDALAKDTFYYLGYDVVQVFDGKTDTVVADIPCKGWLREAGFTADRKFLFVTADRHIIHKIDLAAGKVVKTIDTNGRGGERLMFGFALAPDGKTAYAHILSRAVKDGEPVIDEPMVAQLDLETGKILRSVQVPWGVGNLISTQGGKTLYTVGQDLIKIDTTGKDLKIVESKQLIEQGMNTLPFWPKQYENNGIAVAPYYTPTSMGVLMIDVNTGEITDKKLEDISMVYTMVMSPDKKRAYGNMDDVVAYDFETGKIAGMVPNEEGTNFSISISTDGSKIYTAAGGYTLTVYDAASLKPLKVVKMATDGMDMIRMPD